MRTELLYTGDNAGEVVSIVTDTPYDGRNIPIDTLDKRFVFQAPNDKPGEDGRVLYNTIAVNVGDWVWRDNDEWGIIAGVTRI